MNDDYKKLSVQLKKWRADRPDEWKMDQFYRMAKALEDKIEELEKHERI